VVIGVQRVCQLLGRQQSDSQDDAKDDSQKIDDMFTVTATEAAVTFTAQNSLRRTFYKT